jgi:hypothetical protein
MIIIAFFTDSGSPKTGLSPTIRKRKLSDDSLVVTDVAMTEVGDGFYKYSFSAYDRTLDYAIRVDGGAALADNDRYKYGSNVNQIVEEKLHEVWQLDGLDSGHSMTVTPTSRKVDTINQSITGDGETSATVTRL